MKSWLWRYSVSVCRRPRQVIAACVAVTLACSLGLIRVRVITNPELIWVPPNSLANRQKEFFDEAFSPFFRVNQVFFVAEAANDGDDGDADMLQKQYLQRVMGVQRAIEGASFISAADGETRGFESLCFKPIDGEGCLVESPSQYWLDDPVLLAGDPSPSLTAACQTSDAFLASRSPCMDKIGTPVMREVVFGDIGVNPDVVSPDPCGGSVPAAGALVLTFLLNNYQDPEYQQLAEQWEKEVFLAVVEAAQALLENDVQAPMKMSYMAQRSVADSLSVEAGENAWVLAVSYLCMFLYVSLILGNPCHAVRSRYSLALTGITIVVASLATTIGLLSLAGVGTTLIVWEVVPFLTLAIGVDNMVILSREFDRLEAAPEFEISAPGLCNTKGMQSRGASGPTYAWAGSRSMRGSERTEEFRLENRMGAAVSKVAPSILGAAVCEAVAFLVGALTDIPALRQFCLVAATAVAVGFVLQVTWFMAALSLDARRVSQGRLDLAPWLKKREAKDSFDPLNSESRGISFPLIREESPEQQSVSSFHRSGSAAPGAATSGNGDDDWSSPEDTVAEAFNRLTSGSGGDDHDDLYSRHYRALTSEFGSGSEANPALFARRAVRPYADTVASHSRRRMAGLDGTGGIAPPGGGSGGGSGIEAVIDGSINSRTIGGSHSGGDGSSWPGQRLDRGGTRRWFDDPSSYDDDDALFSKEVNANEKSRSSSNVAQEERPLLESSPGEAKSSTDRAWRKPDKGNASASGLSGEAASSKAGGLRLAEADHFVLGGDVVEGYVSLGPELRRCVSGDGGGGGLLVSGPPDDSEGKGAGGLSMFREQMYEEGRHKGNLASRLLNRYYLPALFSRGGKTFTLAVAAGLALLGGFGLSGLEMGLEPQLAAPTDFYLQDYYEAQFSLGEAGPPAYVVFGDVDYFGAFNDSEIRQSFQGVSTGLAQLQRYVQAPIYSWFDTMVAWVNQRDTLAADCPTQVEVTDEASFYSMVELFLSIPIESQCCQSYGVCGAQFVTDVSFESEGEAGFRRISASRLRFNMQPLNTQRDFVNSYYYVKLVTNQLADKIPERYDGQRKANKNVGNLAFPYSLYFVFYEQYAFIQGVALQNIALALAVVFLSISLLSGFAIAAIVTSLVLCTTLGTVGLVWAWGELSSAPYDVSVNAVSVCNLVMSLGLSVEFCLHVAMAFQRVPGTRQERAEAAMKSAGASVLTGITLTKLVGVSVLAIAPSLLFRVYYFRMYMATVVAGAFQGLAVLPVLLSICGPRAPVTASPSPRPSSWMDNWGDNHYDMAPSPSPLHYDDRTGGRGYHDLGGERQGGSLKWNWERSGAAAGELWGEEEQAEGAPGGGAVRGSLTLPLASHMQPDGDVVL